MIELIPSDRSAYHGRIIQIFKSAGGVLYPSNFQIVRRVRDIGTVDEGL
jgi:hypothetical protein